MKKIIVFASALALAGGVSYAMEEDAMDKDMMMEAPAPSVSVGASGEIGVKNTDDDDKPNAESVSLIRAYKVTFDSTGTTDGGLMFGAGMSMRDDTTEENVPTLKGSYAFVGAGDGSWKLQLGENDPGIDLAGGIGIADDFFGGEGNTDIALSGSFEGATFRISMADPQAMGAEEDDWSVGASYGINDINAGVGMDSEKGLAIGVGTELSGVGVSLYYSKAEFDMMTLHNIFAPETGGATGGTTRSSAYEGTQEWSGLGAKASMSAGEGATFSLAYSTNKVEYAATHTIVDGSPNTPVTSNSEDLNHYNGSHKTKKIEIDFSYDLGGGATFNAGIDKQDGEGPTNLNIGDTTASRAADADGARGISETPADVTTLSASIAFSF